jgi:hypothetical protein
VERIAKRISGPERGNFGVSEVMREGIKFTCQRIRAASTISALRDDRRGTLEEETMPNTPTKCAHAACTCTAPVGKKFCSTHCEGTKSMMTLACHCGHNGCDEKAK